MKVFVSEIKDYDVDKIRVELDNILSEMGFWEKIENLKTILLKPNMLGAFEPEKQVTTHPTLLEAVILLLQEHNKEIWVGDSPGGTVLVEKVWSKTGIKKVCEKNNIKLLNFSSGGVQELKTDNHYSYTVSKYFQEAEAVINLPKYKTHSLMYYTGAIKNLYGIIPGMKKSDYHKNYPTLDKFTDVITGLYSLASPKIVLNILDGIWGMEGEGPSAGIKRNFGLMMVSEKASALDYYASKMMGFALSQVKYIQKSLQIDNLQINELEISDKWQNFTFDNVKIKRVSAFVKILSYSPPILQNFFKKYFEYKPDFNDKCRLCRVCVNSCPVNAMTLNSGDKHPKIDYSICIKCMCCHEMCPYHAVYINKSFLAKLILKD